MSCDGRRRQAGALAVDLPPGVRDPRRVLKRRSRRAARRDLLSRPGVPRRSAVRTRAATGAAVHQVTTTSAPPTIRQGRRNIFL